jgi:sugar lactone lactonase YvrE
VNIRNLVVLLIGLEYSYALAQQPGIITTVAGSGRERPLGSPLPATKALVFNPKGLAFDSKGNLYISDEHVDKLSTSGLLIHFAGTSELQHRHFQLGDGGPPENAWMDFPMGMTFDNRGNLYIADTQHNRIRKVSINGIVTTVAGTDSPLIGNGLFIGGFSGDGGLATNALLDLPMDVAVDRKENLYIADTNNHRIRKVDKYGVISTIAGGDPVGYSPSGQSLGGYNGDNILATEAKLYFPNSVAVDPEGNLYIADKANCRIRKVDLKGIITTIAGTGEFRKSPVIEGLGTTFPIPNPHSIALDAGGNLYVAEEGLRAFDNEGGYIRKISPDGYVTTVAGSKTAVGLGDGGPALSADLALPNDVAINAEGDLFIADFAHDRIRKVSKIAIPTSTILKGDLNGDGEISIRDAVLSLLIAIGDVTPSAMQRSSGEVTGDNLLNIEDTLSILWNLTGQ